MMLGQSVSCCAHTNKHTHTHTHTYERTLIRTHIKTITSTLECVYYNVVVPNYDRGINEWYRITRVGALKFNQRMLLVVVIIKVDIQIII